MGWGNPAGGSLSLCTARPVWISGSVYTFVGMRALLDMYMTPYFRLLWQDVTRLPFLQSRAYILIDIHSLLDIHRSAAHQLPSRIYQQSKGVSMYLMHTYFHATHLPFCLRCTHVNIPHLPFCLIPELKSFEELYLYYSDKKFTFPVAIGIIWYLFCFQHKGCHPIPIWPGGAPLSMIIKMVVLGGVKPMKSRRSQMSDGRHPPCKIIFCITCVFRISLLWVFHLTRPRSIGWAPSGT